MASLKDLIVNGATRFMNAIHTNGIKMTQGTDYGSTKPSNPTKGQVFFQNSNLTDSEIQAGKLACNGISDISGKSSLVTVVPNYSYTDFGVAVGVGMSEGEFMKAWLKKIATSYPKRWMPTFMGVIMPNSCGFAICTMYNTGSGVNSEGMPQYSMGFAYRLGGSSYTFGTANYEFYLKQIITG